MFSLSGAKTNAANNMAVQEQHNQAQFSQQMQLPQPQPSQFQSQPSIQQPAQQPNQMYVQSNNMMNNTMFAPMQTNQQASNILPQGSPGQG